jgi:hypothetical protein
MLSSGWPNLPRLASLLAPSEAAIECARDVTWQRCQQQRNGANAGAMSAKTLMDITRALMKGQQPRRAP